MSHAPEILPNPSAPPPLATDRPAEGGARFSLRQGEFLSLRLAHGESLALNVMSGLLWATLEGDPNDHLMGSGESRLFVGPGHLVVEGLAAESWSTGNGSGREGWSQEKGGGISRHFRSSDATIFATSVVGTSQAKSRQT